MSRSGLTPAIARALLEDGELHPATWQANGSSFASIISTLYKLMPYVRREGRGKGAVFYPVDRHYLEDLIRGGENGKKEYDFGPLIIAWEIQGTGSEWKGPTTIHSSFVAGETDYEKCPGESEPCVPS